MATNPWEDFAQRSRELYQQQAELARTWLDGQTKLASTLAGAGQGGEGGMGADAAAMADLWRSWLAVGSSLGSAVPGMTGSTGKVASEGEAAKQWLKDFYQDNKLLKSELELGGRKVDLQALTMPVLNIYAQDDHIIPPPTSRVLEGKVGTKDHTELGLPGGHIGVFVSGKSQGIVGKGIVDWLSQRDG